MLHDSNYMNVQNRHMYVETKRRLVHVRAGGEGRVGKEMGNK